MYSLFKRRENRRRWWHFLYLLLLVHIQLLIILSDIVGYCTTDLASTILIQLVSFCMQCTHCAFNIGRTIFFFSIFKIYRRTAREKCRHENGGERDDEYQGNRARGISVFVCASLLGVNLKCFPHLFIFIVWSN